MKKTAYEVQYESLGEWYLYKTFGTREEAQSAIDNRNNPVAACRIVERKIT